MRKGGEGNEDFVWDYAAEKEGQEQEGPSVNVVVQNTRNYFEGIHDLFVQKGRGQGKGKATGLNLDFPATVTV